MEKVLNNYEEYIKRKKDELSLFNASVKTEEIDKIETIKKIINQKLKGQASLKSKFLEETYNCQNTSRNSQKFEFNEFKFEYEYQRYDIEIEVKKYMDKFYKTNLSDYSYVFTNCGMSALFATIYALKQLSFKIYYKSNIYVETERLIDDYIQKDELSNNEKSALLIDTVSFIHINKLLEDINLSSYDLFIIDTTLYLPEEMKIVLDKLRLMNKPIILIKSHTKMDTLGSEWATLGSICMIDAESTFNARLFKEIRIILSFIGGFAYQNSIPLFWFDDSYKEVSRKRNVVIKQNTIYLYDKLKSKYQNIKIIKPDHNMFILIEPNKFIDYKKLECDIHSYTNNSKLKDIICYADSFGLDIFGFSGYYENMSAETEVIRISPSDYPNEICDLIFDDFSNWLEQYLNIKGGEKDE